MGPHKSTLLSNLKKTQFPRRHSGVFSLSSRNTSCNLLMGGLAAIIHLHSIPLSTHPPLHSLIDASKCPSYAVFLLGHCCRTG